MTDIPIQIQFVKSLHNLKPSRIIVVKPDNATEFQLYVTDKSGIPFPIKDDTATGTIANIINTDGNISISGGAIKTINLSASILSVINSALQSGDNISLLTNDAGYINHADLSATHNAINVIVNSDVGADAIINLANGVTAGVTEDNFTSAEKNKLLNIQSGAQVNVLETISSTGGTIQVGANISKNINLEVSQATETQLGGGQISTQVTIEDNTTANDTSIVTPKKWWQGFNKATTLAWTWIQKQTFTAAIRLNSTTASTVPYIDVNKDVVSSSVNPTELGHLSGVTSSIQTQLNGKEPTITPSGNITDFWAGNKTWRNLATDVRNVILTGLSFVSSRITASDTILSAFGKLQRQTTELQSTRFISGSGVTINGVDNTKFDIQVVGMIVDPITFIETPINVNLISQTVTHIASQVESYVWIDNSGVVIQSLTPPNPINLDYIVGYWVLVHSNLTNLNVINSFPYYAEGVTIKLTQILSFLGFRKFKDTNIISAGTTGTRLTHTGGNVLKAGIGNTTKRPILNLSGATDTTLRMRNRNGVEGADTQNIDTTNIDIGGVTTSLSNPNRFGAHKVWKFASSLIRVQRGQYEYTNIDAAKTGIKIDAYVDEGNCARNGIHIGWIIFKRGTSWGTGGTGTNGVDYLFIDEIQSASAGTSAVTMQGTYDNSSQPQLTTSTIKGAVQFQGGTGVDSDRIFEGKNNTGAITSWIAADGTSSFRASTSEILQRFTGDEYSVQVYASGISLYGMVTPTTVGSPSFITATYSGTYVNNPIAFSNHRISQTGTGAGSSAEFYEATQKLVANELGFVFHGKSAFTWSSGTADYTGLTGSNAATGNVNPSTLLDSILFGADDTDTNLQFMHNDGSGTATKHDMGSNFALQLHNAYSFMIWNLYGGNTVNIWLRNLRNGEIFQTSVNTDLPASTVGLAPHLWTGNRATVNNVAKKFTYYKIQRQY